MCEPGRMELFDELASEHDRISRTLDALERFVSRLEDRKEDVHEVLRFVTFLRGYADGYHHEREETVLFRCLVTAGYAPLSGPIGHLRDQHREEARLLLRVEMAAAAQPPWDVPKRVAIQEATQALVVFERAHMQKETELLFPAAAADLANYLAEVKDASERFMETRAPRWNVPWLCSLADELTAAHGAADDGRVRASGA